MDHISKESYDFVDRAAEIIICTRFLGVDATRAKYGLSLEEIEAARAVVAMETDRPIRRFTFQQIVGWNYFLSLDTWGTAVKFNVNDDYVRISIGRVITDYLYRTNVMGRTGHLN